MTENKGKIVFEIKSQIKSFINMVNNRTLYPYSIATLFYIHIQIAFICNKKPMFSVVLILVKMQFLFLRLPKINTFEMSS